MFILPVRITSKKHIRTYILPEATYNKEQGTDHVSLHFNIQVHGECDTKVVSGGKVFSQKSWPLFADFSHLILHVGGIDLASIRKSPRVCLLLLYIQPTPSANTTYPRL